MKTDARVRYTRMRIREAFWECLAKKPVSKITVKEICDGAEINRATFYKHYTDPFDLLEKLEEEALAEMEKMLRDDERDKDMSQGLMLAILKELGNKEKLYALLTSENGDPGFASRISDFYYQNCRPRLAQSLSGRTEAEKDAAYRFVAGGCGHLISRWIKDGMQISPEQMAEELRGLCLAFMEAYQRQDKGQN